MSALMMVPPGYFTLPSSGSSAYDEEDALSSTSSGSGSCPDSPVLSVSADDEKLVSAAALATAPVPAVGSLLPVAPPAGHFFALAQHGAPQLAPLAFQQQQQQEGAPQLPPVAAGRVIRGKLTRSSPGAAAPAPVPAPAPAPAPAPSRASRKRARGSSPEDDDEYEEEDDDEEEAAARRVAGGAATGGKRPKAAAAPKQRATKKSKNAAGAAVPVVDGKLLTDLVESYKEKQDKLKHKAKLARDSRRKKKERLEQLEGEVARLNALLAQERTLREQEQAAAAKASICICSALSAEVKAAATAAVAPAPAAAVPAPAPLPDTVLRATQNITTKYTEHLHTMMKQFPHAPPFACTSRNLEVDLAKSAALSGLAGRDAAEHAKAVTTTHLNFDAAMETLADGFTGALKSRGDVVELQLAALEKSLEPPVALYFLEWLMTQPDMFYLDPAGIWSKLIHGTLAVSQQQLQALFTLRATVRAQRNAETDLRIQALGLNASLMAFAAMRSASAAGGNAAADTSAADVSLFSALPQQIAAHMSMHRSFQVFSRLTRLHLSGLEGYIKGLRAILSPAQLALFFAFVEENAAVCTLVH